MTKRSEETYKLFLAVKKMSNIDLAAKLGISRSTAWHRIQDLMDEGVVRLSEPYQSARGKYDIGGGSPAIYEVVQ